ncbi:hypothetical protein Nepgr_004778 [Nepenthes gracilis]|uniref:FAD-binding domain-containing protein n=1 Tax=Nepenthes gracilis TaxID=150966 RepID=A0AAD3XFJ3_NEPGR|nr:hypothetical protein Nepgr_004778 [Nepenthes gracilis]
MESKEDIVIVGAGIAGLATALGLHRLGLRSLVIESSPCLRATGAAFTTWTNAWRALDALGIGDSLRRQHLRLDGISKLIEDKFPAKEERLLGFKSPTFVERSTIRGFAVFEGSHELEPKIQQFMGNGVIYGFIPCDEIYVYWFFAFSSALAKCTRRMESKEDIVIVGAGIAGLATALGLHRLGLRSLVIESSPCLRATGAAFTTWTNAWRALDALGIGDSLRRQHLRLDGIDVISSVTGFLTAEDKFPAKEESGGHELRCLKRKVLLETLANELPNDAIKFSSKVVFIEDLDCQKLLHLADGSILKAKVFEGSHELEPKIQQFMGNGVIYGFIPCDEIYVYWFFAFSSSGKDIVMEEDPMKMKQFVLSYMEKIPGKLKNIIEKTKLNDIICTPQRSRAPWEILLGNISKGTVCVAGDAFHPMTPDLGQGACSALEDAVILARCLADGLTKMSTGKIKSEFDYERIKINLKKYAKERRWRGFDLVITTYIVGAIHQSDRKVVSFLRDKILTKLWGNFLLRKADFQCGQLLNI